MKLYGGRLSPYFERVMLVLALKGARDRVQCAGVPGGLGSAEWQAINPIGKIPALAFDDGRVLPESQVIADYFDELYPEPALMPADLEARTNVRLVCRLVDSYVSPALGPVFKLIREGTTSGAALDEAAAGLGRALDILEHFMSPGSRAVGDDWTMADCVLIPVLFPIRTFAPRIGFDPFAGRPKLAAYHEAIAQTELYRESEAGMKAGLAEFMARIAAAQAQA